MEDWEDAEDIFQHYGLPYILKIIQTKLICHLPDDLSAGFFSIDKTCNLLARKYYLLTLCRDVQIYVQRHNVYFVSKTVRHKLYDDLKSFPVPTHYWNNVLMNFVIGLLLSPDWKEDSYNAMFDIVD